MKKLIFLKFQMNKDVVLLKLIVLQILSNKWNNLILIRLFMIFKLMKLKIIKIIYNNILIKKFNQKLQIYQINNKFKIVMKN